MERVDGKDYQNIGSLVADTVDINGGTVDGVVIGGSSAGAISGTTGTFSGIVKGGSDEIESAGDITITAVQFTGSVVYVTQTGTVTCPPVADIVEGGSITVYSTTAAAVHVDPNASEVVVLDGVALTGGNKITSASGAGDQITLVKRGSTLVTVGRSGTWTDGG